MTLHEALARHGLKRGREVKSTPSNRWAAVHEIIDATGRVHFVGTGREVWRFVRELG